MTGFSDAEGALTFDVLPLRGWRGWTAILPGDGLLRPLVRDAAPAWTPGWNTALHHTLANVRCQCDPCRIDESCRGIASRDCKCGFYAYTDLNITDGMWRTVTGIIEGAGRCSWGIAGFRAEKARVVALTRESPDDRPGTPQFFEAVIKRNADRYGVPVFDTLAEAVEAFPLTPKHREAA